MDEEKKEDVDVVEERSSVRDSLKQGMYYIIIAVISLISVVFLPMLGSTLGLGWKLPNTTAGWVVWGASRAIVATINVLLFHSFMEQAKLNIKDDEHYKEARDILVKVKKKERAQAEVACTVERSAIRQEGCINLSCVSYERGGDWSGCALL